MLVAFCVPTSAKGMKRVRQIIENKVRKGSNVGIF